MNGQTLEDRFIELKKRYPHRPDWQIRELAEVEVGYKEKEAERIRQKTAIPFPEITETERVGPIQTRPAISLRHGELFGEQFGEVAERPITTAPEGPVVAIPEKPTEISTPEIPKQGRVLTPEEQTLKNQLLNLARSKTPEGRKAFYELYNKVLTEKYIKKEKEYQPQKFIKPDGSIIWVKPESGKEVPKGLKPYEKAEKELTKQAIDKLFANYNIARVKAKNDPFKTVLATALVNQGITIDPSAEWPQLTRQQFEEYIKTGILSEIKEEKKSEKLSPKIQKEYDLATKNIEERPHDAEAIKKEYKRRTGMDYK